jgi:hypothetical protein
MSENGSLISPGEPPAKSSEALGGQAPAQVETAAYEPQDIRPIPDTAINDILKAETMAYAGDELRTKAVQNRDVERDWKKALHDHDDEDKEALDSLESTKLNFKRRRQLHEQLDQSPASADAISDKWTSDNKKTVEQFREDFPDKDIPFDAYPDDTSEEAASNKRADLYDKRASRLEDWAGRLHDHPIGEDFLKEHPDIEITPLSLVRMEDDAETLELEISGYEEGAGQGVGDYIGALVGGRVENSDGPSQKEIGEIYEMLALVGKDKGDQWQQVSTKLLEAADAADVLHKELTYEARIKPLRNQLGLMRKLLDDVRDELAGGTPAQ